MAGRSHPVTLKKRARFLEALAECGNVTRSAEVAGISREYAHRLRRADPAFAEQWEQAMLAAAPVLEEEAWRRAHDGTAEPLTSAKGLIYDEDGQPVTVQKYSDTLLIFLLKGLRPEKYRENVKVSGTLQHGLLLPAPQDRAVLLALRARFRDRPEVLDEIAVALKPVIISEETSHVGPGPA